MRRSGWSRRVHRLGALTASQGAEEAATLARCAGWPLPVVSPTARSVSCRSGRRLWVGPAGQHGRNRVGRGVPDILLPVELPNGKKASVSLSTSSHSRTGVLRGARARRLGAHRSVQALPELHEGHQPVRQGQGYAFVMVHTRGFGRSTGCPDFGEPGEQADVKAAIKLEREAVVVPQAQWT